jgi:hypothetical protein
MNHEEELVGYVLCHMLTGEQMSALCRSLGLKVPGGSRVAQCRAVAPAVRFADLHAHCLKGWNPPNANVHLENLTSGMLEGFSWHNLAPSHLHMGLQGHVRRVAAGELSLPQFLELGSDVIKKEYVMVAVADLTELTLVHRCGGTPPLRDKSLSDVVLGGYPFDVKNTSVPNGWSATQIRNDPASFATAMFEGADSERVRKQAQKAFNDWAVNRLFVVTEHEERWLSEPESLMDELASQAMALGDPYDLEADDVRMLVHVIVL